MQKTRRWLNKNLLKFSGNSLKEDLLIDTTFDPVIFCETVPLKGQGHEI